MASKQPVRCDMFHPVLPVQSISETTNFYVDKLGFSVGFLWGDPPDLAGLNFDRVSMHVVAGKPTLGATIYFVVDDVDAYYQQCLQRGVAVGELADQAYGMRDFAVVDNNGYELQFGSHAPANQSPLTIERQSMEVRMEKRLLALVKDLADSKGMSVDEMLEETLLHTFEPAPGGGVASPHTPETLRLIEQLKQSHGIDYETHDSYRFVE